MTHFRLRWQKLGAHVHVGVWTGTEQATTHGHNGRLVFRENEWEDLLRLIFQVEAARGPLSAIEIVEDEPTNVRPDGSAVES